MTSPFLWRVEESARNAWPALEEVFFDGWLIRFANGLSRRANSANPLTLRPQRSALVIEEIRALYQRRGRPAIFRLPSFLAPEMDQRLDHLGYRKEGESVVLFGPARGAKPALAPEVALAFAPGAHWFAAMARLQGYSKEEAAAYRAILGRIALPAAFASLSLDGEIAALGYAVAHRRLVHIGSMITDPRRRRSGFARRILEGLAGWGKTCGANGFSLEVDAENAPARALYAAFGIDSELYRYHYRQEPLRQKPRP